MEITEQLGSPSLENRPFYKKQQGELGIYIDFTDVTPCDKKEYGSLQYMNMDFMDKLYNSLSKVPFYIIKGALTKKGLTDGMILEKWHKGVVLSVSFDSQSSLDQCWREYEKGLVAPVIQQCLYTPELLQDIDATSIKLRAQMWKDEYQACMGQMENVRLKSFTLRDKPNDQQLLRDIKEYQKKELIGISDDLKHHYETMDKSFPDLTVTLKKNLPIKVTKIPTFKKFMEHYKAIQTKKNINRKPFEDYISMRNKLLEAADTVEANIYHRLAQIHGACHTQHQAEMKVKIKEGLDKIRELLSEDFVWSETKCPDWHRKILNREHPFFLGMASTVSLALNAILDVDLQCDDYMSGVEEGIKL